MLSDQMWLYWVWFMLSLTFLLWSMFIYLWVPFKQSHIYKLLCWVTLYQMWLYWVCLCWVSHFYCDQCSYTEYHLSSVTYTNYYAECHFTKCSCTEYVLCWFSHFHCDQCSYTEYHLSIVTFWNSYAECHYSECHQPKIVSTVFITTNTAV